MEDFDIIIGKTLDEAKEIIRPYGWYIRCVKRDTIPAVITHDLRANRVNVVIKNNVITKIDGIG